jgi:hypothetical protein
LPGKYNDNPGFQKDCQTGPRFGAKQARFRSLVQSRILEEISSATRVEPLTK